jgi:NADH-quinone oxidoreductase subunit L
MFDLLYLIPALPFAGFLILGLVGKRMTRTTAAWIGAGCVGISTLITVSMAISFISAHPSGHHFTQTCWQWLSVGGFATDITLTLDALSLIMVLVITIVGFLILLYSTEHMDNEEEGYSRFFAYMNLFVGSMLVLVLADNLLLLYLGWEGVGLCSYLLIGFWYKDPANGRAAMKAFIVTRIGDAALAIALLIIYYQLGTLQISMVLERAAIQWPVGSTMAVAAAALLLGGAVGKSAQIPLQTWLPDAMAGPTPVSALIHAATMVTAGVYLIARTHVIFTLAPPVMLAVAVIGAATLLLAGISAIMQSDIKRALAYSTMSQIGYMFLALGVGAWSAAMFHFMTHAFFKALLFLSAGAVINALHHERNMFNMGGLRKQMPFVFWVFLIGAASLSALPLVTAGFYSKDMIISAVWSSGFGFLQFAGIAGALLTSIYAFRMVFLLFYGKANKQAADNSGWRIRIPLALLAALSLIAGFIETPGPLGNIQLFSDFIESAMPAAAQSVHSAGLTLIYLSAAASLSGIFIAYIFFLYNREYAKKMTNTPLGYAVHCFLSGGWNFDLLYNSLFVRPFIAMARINKNDAVDLIYSFIAFLHMLMNHILVISQNGIVRRYAFGLAAGAAIIIGVAVWS